MTSLSYPHIGNANLLKFRTVAFLAPSHISTLSVLSTLKWTAEIARREDVAVVSGYSSRLEHEVFSILLRGKCGIILVLARQLYKQLPDVWQQPLSDNRLLIISSTNQSRQSRQVAKERNILISQMADETIMPCVPPRNSSLFDIYNMLKEKNGITTLVECKY